jgi:hypothetical protein
VETKPYEISPDIETRLRDRLSNAELGEIVLLPRAVEEGIAVYQDTHITTAKELRAVGIQASFLVESKDRAFVSEFSHDIVYQIAIGLASNLSWDAAKAFWAYVRARCEGLVAMGEDPKVRLQIAKLHRGDTKIEGLTIEGPATSDIPEALLKILVEDSDD